MNKKERFSWLAPLLPLSFLTIAVTAGIIIALDIKKETDSWLVPILVGAPSGFFCAWLLYFPIGQFYIRVIQGGPFHIGDRVEITKGPHKGKTGTILMIDKVEDVFKIDIGIQSKHYDDNYFHAYAFRRLRKRNNPC